MSSDGRGEPDGFDEVVLGRPSATATIGLARSHVRVATTALDARWASWMTDPRRRRMWTQGAPLLVIVVAALARLWNLGTPHALVFDETYYVKDAWSMKHLGYEGTWGANADPGFLTGRTNNFTALPEFIAHPPLGKWIISLGESVFGVDNAVGWRASTAVVGILLVVLTMVVARHLFRSTLAVVIAGGLIAIDGNAIVLSRVALLDGSVAFFVLLACWFVLLDRDHAARRTGEWIIRRGQAGRPSDWGPALLWRPWLLAAGVAFGAASSVKWNGFYFLAFLAVYTVVSDALARRRLGIDFWLTSAVLKQSWVNFVTMVPIAALVYLSSWTGWFVTKGGYDRDWIGGQSGTRWTGGLAWVPVTLQNWWHYQTEIYGFDVNEHSPHPYAANPLTWLFLVRPTSMYYQQYPNGTAGAISEIANPLIWWACTAAIVFLIVRLVRTRDWRLAFILTGIAAGYLPWMLYLGRTVFQFYTIAFEPFLILGLTAVLLHLLGAWGDPRPRRRAGLITVGVFLGLCVVLSIFWYPMWTGQTVPIWFVRLHYWLPSWI